jgi:single-strand DNA-binding protein
MSKGTVNKVFLIGNVGHPPTIKRNEKCQFAQISLATTQQWRDKVTSDTKEKTDWHNIVIYGKLVNAVEQYVTKGDKICIVGHITTRKWADAEGIEREKVEIIGEEFQVLTYRGKKEEIYPLESPW